MTCADKFATWSDGTTADDRGRPGPASRDGYTSKMLIYGNPIRLRHATDPHIGVRVKPATSARVVEGESCHFK
jgi:hypothetical protein